MAWLKNIIKRISLRGISAVVAVLLSLPLGWAGLTGFYTWLSPFVMLNSVFALKSFVWLNTIAFFVLSLVIFRKRWFCRNLCPVGWGCDRVSSCSRRKGFSSKKWPNIGKWLAISSLVGAIVGMPLFVLLDPMAIFNGFFSVSFTETTLAGIITLLGFPVLLAAHLLFPGIWCAKLCPLGGLQVELYQIKKQLLKIKSKGPKTKPIAPLGRRLFLASGLGIIAGLALPHMLWAKTKSYFKPPGAVPGGLFNALCIRCGNCIKSCPTGILVHRADTDDKAGWMVPEIDFNNGYCLEDCNLCSQVCPSGAITLFEKAAKSQLPIGLAVILPENCLLTKNKECDRCKTSCFYDAITIEAVGDFNSLPIINTDRCIGCGACFVICPPITIRMINIA